VQKLFDQAKADVEAGNEEGESLKLLESRMLKRIAFGTAGLRSRMAGGNACMNDLVVIQASQGLATCVAETVKDAKTRGVVIGYDARYNSTRFAQYTAAVFLDLGFKVYLYSRTVGTPLVPFGVSHLKAAAGIMVTASHNPKDDNGYKVYWENGAQIIPPHDRNIAAAIDANLAPWKEYKFDPSNELIVDQTDELVNLYMTQIGENYCWERESNKNSKLKITYTAMHGVGTPYVKQAFESFGLPPFIPVAEQVEEDPDFSTVEFPNPEEGKGALKLAIETADREDSPIILANDPDADRLAVAEKQPDGEWYIFKGNEIAALFADWVWKNYVKQNPDADRSKACMCFSTVSSQFLRSMAAVEGFTCVDTLTGFKWMGNTAYDMIQKGFTFLFAYEIEIGFLIGDISLDKDGIRTASIFTEMANVVYGSGTNLKGHLADFYKKYGYYEMNTGYFFSYTNEVLDKAFEYIRTSNNGSYVTKLGDEIEVTSVRDVTTGFDDSQPDNKCVFGTFPDAHMITFKLSNGCVTTLRNSGTEPKLKYYVEAHNKDSKQAARDLVDKTAALVISELLRPDAVGLIAKKSS